MKLYKNLTLMVLFGMTLVLFGMASAANATTIDPGVILRGDGKSLPVGPTFGGVFQTPAGAPFACPTDGSSDNCFENASGLTFIALHLYFAPNPSLLISCGDNSPDPFFQNCFVTDGVIFKGSPTTEITFSGLGSSDACDGACQGIKNTDHFLVGLVHTDGTPDTTDNTTYSAVAETPIGSTPEPASALLFVIAMGAIALFLKRRSNLISAY
jgi:hypothetical protein